MGIKVEYNPDLALRNISEFQKGSRKIEECIPENLEVGKVYDFLKKDQRNYWIYGEIPLVETKGSEIVSRPKAGILLLEVTHFLENGEVYTKGKYKVVEVFKDDKVNFEGFERIGIRK